jgi:hypothetical protein
MIKISHRLLNNIPAVQSMNQTSGYIATYLFISFVEIESIMTMLVSLLNPKSFLNSLILSIIDVEHVSGVILEPVRLPFACANNTRPDS